MAAAGVDDSTKNTTGDASAQYAADGTPAYDYTNYYQQQQWQQSGATATNWQQYWTQAGVAGAQGTAANGTNAYYGYPANYGTAANGTTTTPQQTTDPNAYYGYYPGYGQYGYSTPQTGQAQQYNYAAAQYAQQYQQQPQQPPPPSHPPPPQPPPPQYPPPSSPNAKTPASSWASVVAKPSTESPAYTGVNFKIAKAAPLQRSGMPAQPLQHIIHQQHQQNKHQQPTNATSQKKEQEDAGNKNPNPNQWPPKLKAYVERVFEKCTEEAERGEMEGELKKVITRSIQENSLWTIDWDHEPLITLPKKGHETKHHQKGKEKKNKRKSEFTLTPEDEERKQRRQKRFLSSMSQSRNSGASAMAFSDGSELDWDQMTVKGYCQDLEKQYLRLTSAPDPATVRPEPVLKKTIKMLREKWEQNEDYDYTCEQLKSVRQDLTVQRIKNGFTVGVYEMHARLALENGDLGEFNQCQTQLKELYREGLSPLHMPEFSAYRILYFLHVQGDVASVLAEIPPAVRKEAAVAHAIQVMCAVAINNYHKFFKLYADPPNMGQYLMISLVKRMRVHAIKAMVKSFRPSFSLDFVQKELGFPKVSDCKEFLKEMKVSIKPGTDGPEIDTKNSQGCLDASV